MGIILSENKRIMQWNIGLRVSSYFSGFVSSEISLIMLVYMKYVKDTR